MLGQFFKKSEDAGTANRLKEMVAVLRKRDVVKGVTPEKLRQILEDLGPTYVKLGQVMSMRPDFLPPEYCDELMKLQTEAKPMPFSTVVEVIEREYNRRWNQVFSFIDEEAIGSASIAQVHRAVLTTGEKSSGEGAAAWNLRNHEQGYRPLEASGHTAKGGQPFSGCYRLQYGAR